MKKKLILSTTLVGLFFIMASNLTAQKAPDGNCSPQPEWVCGMNGQNFMNKMYTSG